MEKRLARHVSFLVPKSFCGDPYATPAPPTANSTTTSQTITSPTTTTTSVADNTTSASTTPSTTPSTTAVYPRDSQVLLLGLGRNTPYNDDDG